MTAALRRGLVAMLLAGGVVVLAVCGYFLQTGATMAAIVLLLAVLLAGAYSRRLEAIVASIVATLCLDYFFIPPFGTISIGDPEGWAILAVFLGVSLVAMLVWFVISYFLVQQYIITGFK